MGERIRKSELIGRWHERMPRFFHRLMVAAVGIGTTVTAINIGIPATGGTLHEWWVDFYPYIFGASIGVAIASKFTCDGGFRRKSIEQLTGRTVLDKDDN